MSHYTFMVQCSSWKNKKPKKKHEREQGTYTYMVINGRLYKISNTRECVSKMVFDTKSFHGRICEYKKRNYQPGVGGACL